MPEMSEELAELLSRAQTLGEPLEFAVVGMDRAVRPATVSVYGPFDGPGALMKADQLRADYDKAELGDVEVHIGAWWGEGEDA